MFFENSCTIFCIRKHQSIFICEMLSFSTFHNIFFHTQLIFYIDLAHIGTFFFLLWKDLNIFHKTFFVVLSLLFWQYLADESFDIFIYVKKTL